MGGLEPVIETVVVDGGTTRTPPGLADADSPLVTMPDGRVMVKEDVLQSRPSGPPAA